MVVADLLLGYVYADFVSGLFHFLEDNFGSEHTPILGGAIRENRRHHIQPTFILRSNYWETIDTAVYLVLAIWLAFYLLFGTLPVALVWTGVFAAHANQLHKYSHMSPGLWPLWYRCARKMYLVQNYHHLHHRDDHSTHYCILTDWLNPILDYVGFWSKLKVGLLWCGLPPAS